MLTFAHRVEQDKNEFAELEQELLKLKENPPMEMRPENPPMEMPHDALIRFTGRARLSESQMEKYSTDAGYRAKVNKEIVDEIRERMKQSTISVAEIWEPSIEFYTYGEQNYNIYATIRGRQSTMRERELEDKIDELADRCAILWDALSDDARQTIIEADSE